MNLIIKQDEIFTSDNYKRYEKLMLWHLIADSIEFIDDKAIINDEYYLVSKRNALMLYDKDDTDIITIYKSTIYESLAELFDNVKYCYSYLDNIKYISIFCSADYSPRKIYNYYNRKTRLISHKIHKEIMLCIIIYFDNYDSSYEDETAEHNFDGYMNRLTYKEKQNTIAITLGGMDEDDGFDFHKLPNFVAVRLNEFPNLRLIDVKNDCNIKYCKDKHISKEYIKLCIKNNTKNARSV